MYSNMSVFCTNDPLYPVSIIQSNPCVLCNPIILWQTLPYLLDVEVISNKWGKLFSDIYANLDIIAHKVKLEFWSLVPFIIRTIYIGLKLS